MTNADSQQFDIAIIGGGMVGASLALGLVEASRRYQLKIAVCESEPLPENQDLQFTPSYDARSTALSFGSSFLFEQLGVWEKMSEGAQAIEHIQVSDKGHFGSVRLDAKQEGVPALGYVAENRWMGKVLLAAMQDADDVITLLTDTQVTGAQNHNNGMTVQVSQPTGEAELTAKLVVIADGGRSGLRESLGIDYQQQDYDQYALITNLTLSQQHQAIAYERFTAEGPIALLPLPDDDQQRPRAALVWSFPDNEIDDVLGLSDQAFLEKLQQQFGYRAGAFVGVGERNSYPLKLSRVKEMVRPNLVVLGNAAHTLHPIAGQGFNLALRGALGLAASIIESLQQGQDIGSLPALQHFEKSLHWDRQKTILFSDRLTKLFANPRLEAIIARNTGLLMMELNPLIKHEFARSAMGLDVAAPKLTA